MFVISMFKKSLMCRLHSGLIGVTLLLLAGCSNSLSFVHPPPASYHVPLPAEINGLWAFEGKDRGERIRVTGQKDGTAHLNFIQTQPSSDPVPAEPLLAQTPRQAQVFFIGPVLLRAAASGPDNDVVGGCRRPKIRQRRSRQSKSSKQVIRGMAECGK